MTEETTHKRRRYKFEALCHEPCDVNLLRCNWKDVKCEKCKRVSGKSKSDVHPKLQRFQQRVQNLADARGTRETAKLLDVQPALISRICQGKSISVENYLLICDRLV